MEMKKIAALFTAAAAGAAMLSSIPVYAESETELVDSGISYTESTETILNPAAGYTSTLWYSCKPGDTPVYNPTGNFMLILIDIGGFSSGVNGIRGEDGSYTPGTDYDLDETFFTNVRQTLQHARENGCTIALRFRYDANGYTNPEPATYDKMVEHIRQIEADGMLEDYRDILAFVESGFVGSWGEHWGGKYCSFEDKARLLDLLLEIVPEEIPVTVRTPLTFTTWAGIEEDAIDEYVSEPGSPASRVCLYNDGYMGSNSDLGTYRNRERDLIWVARQSVTSYYGGEFSGNLEFTQQYDTYLPENSIPEMYQTHLSYINSNIYQLYKDYTFGAEYDVEGVDNSAYYGETVWKFMRDHLGYRFVIRDCDLTAETEQGGVLKVAADIENTGFANPIMKQKAELILEKDGEYIRTEIDVDTRTWYSCTTASPVLEMKLPGGIETGEWNIYLKLSIGNNTIDQMHMRSVKFANEGTWSYALGANYMGTFTVTASEDKQQLADREFYQLNTENEISHSDGSVFTTDEIAVVDGTVTAESERTEEKLYNETDAGNKLWVTNDEKYLYVMAEINHSAQSPVYNLKIKNADQNKEYWLYYQNNGFIYFNSGKPYGCIQKHTENTVEFRVPLGELCGLEAGTVISNICVAIQDESNSWTNVGEVNSGEYIVSGNFNVYSGKQSVYLTEGESITFDADTAADGLTYQWYKDGTPIEGAAESSYTIEKASTDSKGVYSVEMTSASGTVKTADICQVMDVFSSAAKGDVNLDGEVSLLDAVLLQKYLVTIETLTSQQKTAGDMDENGSVTVLDLTLLKKTLKGEI